MVGNQNYHPYDTSILQGSSLNKQDETFTIIVYNYFLDGFPKSYSLAPNDTLYDLTTLILNDNKQLKREGIKKFVDQLGRQVSYNIPISQVYPSQYKLQMEIIFNEDIKITNNNKQIEFFMLNQSKQSRKDIFNAITVFHVSEKGGKIIVGVNQDGLIKGETIPDQDKFKGEFEAEFRYYLASTCKSIQVAYDIEISFFRVKGQSKQSYKYQDHKKIMIVKIKGTNQQAISNKTWQVQNENNITFSNQQQNCNVSQKKQRKPLNINSAFLKPYPSINTTDTSSHGNSFEGEEEANQQNRIGQQQKQEINVLDKKSTESFEVEEYLKNRSCLAQKNIDMFDKLNIWDVQLLVSF